MPECVAHGAMMGAPGLGTLARLLRAAARSVQLEQIYNKRIKTGRIED
ncbi:MAG: hypothetical protein ACE5K1_10235 [Acidiferrobacterales bacterium]